MKASEFDVRAPVECLVVDPRADEADPPGAMAGD
jgi:hypothetical protein